MQKKVLDTKYAHLSYENNVLSVIVKDDLELGVEEMESLLATAVEFTNYEKYFCIIDTRKVFGSVPAIRDYYANSDYSKYRYADAIIAGSLGMNLLVNFFISFNKPKVPTKMFSNEQDALKWIQKLQKEQLEVGIKLSD